MLWLDSIWQLDFQRAKLLPSFKCTPDAFVMVYFKQIMESYGKPYLILQLDDHDSSVGYETRIEAAIRSFKNHYTTNITGMDMLHAPALMPSREKRVGNRTLLIPNWDSVSLRFIVAAFQKEGIDARLLEEKETTIQKSLRYNTGQCIPLNIIAQEAISGQYGSMESELFHGLQSGPFPAPYQDDFPEKWRGHGKDRSVCR